MIISVNDWIHDWVVSLRYLDSGIGVALVGLGLAMVVQGHRFYRPMVVLTYMGVGFGIACLLAEELTYRWLIAAGAGLAAGVLSFLLNRLSVASLGGAVGMVIVIGLLSALKLPEEVVPILGGAVFLALAAMAFVNWMEAVVFIMALEGAFLLVSGVGALTNLRPAWFSLFHGMVVQNAVFLPLALFFPAMTGFVLQLASVHAKESGGGQ